MTAETYEEKYARYEAAFTPAVEQALRMARDIEDPPLTALVAALQQYLEAAEQEVARARRARNREVVALYGQGVPVVSVAEALGVTPKAVYKVLDGAE